MVEILAITGPIFIIIAVGFAAVRMEMLSKSDVRILGGFVINFALPALLFKALSQRSFAEIMNTDYLVAYALGSLAVMSIGVCLAYFGQKKSLQVARFWPLENDGETNTTISRRCRRGGHHRSGPASTLALHLAQFRQHGLRRGECAAGAFHGAHRPRQGVGWNFQAERQDARHRAQQAE